MLRPLPPDFAHVEQQRVALACPLGTPLCYLEETSSTNDEAKRGAREGAPHGMLWLAETQHAGRGRQGRAWFAKPGENLLCSLLLRTTECPPSRLSQLSLVVGLSVRDALAQYMQADSVQIKWPNDVLIRERKVAGVLLETTTLHGCMEAVVVGIGINVHGRSFPAELALQATSLALESSSPLSRGDVLLAVLRELARNVPMLFALGLTPFLPRLTQADALYGKRVFNDRHGVGEACGIDQEGALRVKEDSGAIVCWNAGEIHLLPAREGTLHPSQT